MLREAIKRLSCKYLPTRRNNEYNNMFKKKEHRQILKQIPVKS